MKFFPQSKATSKVEQIIKFILKSLEEFFAKLRIQFSALDRETDFYTNKYFFPEIGIEIRLHFRFL